MPVVRLRARNEYGHADPELYGAADRDDPEALLEGVAMAGLVGVLRQLGDLAEFAAGIFHNLHEEVMSTSARGHSLMLRVQQLEAEFPVIEKAFLSQTTHLHAVNNPGIEWHPNIQISQNLITSGDMPRFILDSYEECRGPPRLFMLDKFDVAGAGACLKRYSDPSFFKTDLTSSGAIEPELQRENRPRKTKRKNLRWRNDENLDSPAEPHTLILNHMHPEKAQTVPVKRVKLKTKPLNYRDSTTSYMERVLESYIPSGDISTSNTIEHSPLKTSTADPNVPTLEIHVSTADVSFNGESAVEEKKKEIEQMIAKSLPIDEAELQLQSFGSPERIIEDDEENALKILVKETSIELNQLETPADAEDRMDAGSDVYVSDDVASEPDNYMDALATIESEIETDNENRPKPQFSLSDEELQEIDAEAHNDYKRKSLQLLSADLSEDQHSNSLSETEVSCFANKNPLRSLSDPISVQNGQVHRQVCENAEITSPPANKESFGFPIQLLADDKLQNIVYRSQISLSDSPVVSGVSSSGEHDLISEQEHSSASKFERQNFNNENISDVSSSISETVEASCSSLPMLSASPTNSCVHGNHGTDHPTIANPHTTYLNSIVGDVCQQSDPGENCTSSDKANVSSVYNDADNTRAPINISDSDLKCLLDDFEPLSMVNKSLVEGAQIEAVIPDVSQELLLDAENLTLIPNYEDNVEIKPCLDCAVDPTQDTLNTEAPKSYGCEGVSSWNGQSSYAAGKKEPYQSDKKEIDGHQGFATLSEGDIRDAPVTSLDASSDAIVAGPGPTTVSDIKDSEGRGFTSADVAAISSANKSQTFKDEKCELFSDNAMSEKLPALSSPQHNLPGSEEVFSDALDNDGLELSVNRGDRLSLSPSCITSEFHLLSTEEHTPRSNVDSDRPKSDDDNYEQNYFPNSDSSVQLLEDTTVSNPLSVKQYPEKVEYLSSLIQEESVTDRAGFSSSQNEENGETLNQACDGIVDQQNVSLSCGELSALKSVSTDRNNIVEFHTSCEQDLDHGTFLKHDCVPDMHDEHADVSPTELHAQGTTVDSYHGNEEVEIGTHEKEPRQPNMISVREPIDSDLGELSQCSDKEEVEVAVIQKFTAKDEIISLSPSASYSDTIDDVSLVHKPMPLTAVSLDEADSSAAVDESDAGPNLEPLSHRTAGEHVTLTPEPSAAGTIQLNSESILSAIPIFISGEKENSSNHDSQLDAVPILEQLRVSHDSQSLSDPQMVHSMPGRTSITVGSKDNIETDLSRSEADPNISLTDASMLPTLLSLKPSSETLGSIDDESNLLLLSSSTSEVGAHSEIRVALQPNFKPSSLPLEDSAQVTGASVSSPCLPMANPTHKNTSESTGNGLLYNFPILGPDIEGNLNDTPPLPPLPPLQWRMGKPRISPQGSIATTSKSLSGSGNFSTISSNELFSVDRKTLGVSVQGAEASSRPTSTVSRNSQSGSTEDVPSLALDGQSAITENMRTQTLSLDTTDVKIENSLRRRKALQDEMTPSTNALGPVVESSEVDSQRISSISYAEQVQPSGQSILPLNQSIDVHQHYAVLPQSFQRDLLYPSNPFLDAPVTVDPRYQYGYRLFGGENLQPLATQDIIPRHGFYMPVGENVYGPYSISLTEMETEKPNGRPLSILNRPRDPLIEAVASHDKSTLRKVSEIVQAQAKPKDDERNTMLDQIKQKSFSLKRTTITRPSISKGHTTNLKVAAILEKANAIRQAFAGSDDEDNWSDG